MKNYSIVVKQMLPPGKLKYIITIDVKDGTTKKFAIATMSDISEKLCQNDRAFFSLESSSDKKIPHSAIIDCRCGPVLMELTERE